MESVLLDTNVTALHAISVKPCTGLSPEHDTDDNGSAKVSQLLLVGLGSRLEVYCIH